MKLRQLPWLASALSMTVGLYLLASPFQNDREGVARLLSPWGILTLYEFTVIGMIALLHRRGIETAALVVVSLFFLVDPVFLGDAFASTSVRASRLLNASGLLLGLVKAGTLARARAFPVTPWLAGWVAAAIGLIHLIPTLIAGAVAQPAFSSVVPLGLTWCAAAVSVPLARLGKLGWAGVAALGVHFLASAEVFQVDLTLDYLTPPQLALACLLPWPRYGWMPLPSALYCSWLRPHLHSAVSTMEGLGWLLVTGAFFFLGVGFWRSLRARPGAEAPAAAPPGRPSPAGRARIPDRGRAPGELPGVAPAASQGKS